MCTHLLSGVRRLAPPLRHQVQCRDLCGLIQYRMIREERRGTPLRLSGMLYAPFVIFWGARLSGSRSITWLVSPSQYSNSEGTLETSIQGMPFWL